jgi:hypothetical protein
MGWGYSRVIGRAGPGAGRARPRRLSRVAGESSGGNYADQATAGGLEARMPRAALTIATAEASSTAGR